MKSAKALSTLVAVLLAGVLSVRSVHACGQCVVNYHLCNDSRKVTGTSLTQECPGGGHSAPWGNWGADVDQFGSRINGLQFQGWHWESPWFQWNSCTSNQNDYPLGNSSYYNYPTSGSNAFSQQVSNSENQVSTVLGTRSYTVPCPRQDPIGESGGCEDVEAYLILENVFMSLYEMDAFPLPGDDFITTLNYAGLNSLRLRLECGVHGCDSDIIEEWNYAHSNGVSAWAAIRHFSSGLNLTNCQDDGPKREF